MLPSAWLAVSLALAIASLPCQHEGVTTPKRSVEAVDFTRDVQPILAQHCYQCHGPDEKKRKAKLRLDRPADAFAAREDGAAFVAGKPEDSLAIERVLSTDPDEQMPPPEADDPLKADQVETLRRWLQEGGKWSQHWSFRAPERPALPTVADAAWPRTDVDRFVLARLEREHLRPSPEASREAWLRRVTFDLIGLPPSVREMDDFLRDTSAEAHAKVVDRLLADPRYGERQAVEWLDVARYADSSGYQRDTSRIAWKWRDWVIEAFNANMPFDQFTVEQLAGDLLPNPTLAQRIATGFNRNHPVNTEAGEELDEYRSAYVIDRVHTTATTWLGLSVACAQCHDHKYDPISQREFYSFYGFFNHVKERDSGGFSRNPKPSIPAPGPDDVPRLADLDRRIKTLEERLEKDDPLADAAQGAWEKQALDRIGAPVVWTTLEPTELMARHGSRLKRLDDGSILATGPTPARDTYDLVYAPGKRKIQALRIEVLPDPSLPHAASGRADDGRFILSSLEVRLASVAESGDPPLVAYALAAADLNQKRDEDVHYLTAIEPGSFSESIAVGKGGDGEEGSFRGGGGWSVAGDERKEPREAILIPVDPLEANDTSILRVTLHQNSRSKFKSLLGRFRVSFTEDARVRSHLVAVSPSLWRSVGPFPAATAEAAHATAFAPEQDLAVAQWKAKYEQPVLPTPTDPKAGPGATDKKGKPGKPEAGPAGGEDKGKPAEPDETAPPPAEPKTREAAPAKPNPADKPGAPEGLGAKAPKVGKGGTGGKTGKPAVAEAAKAAEPSREGETKEAKPTAPAEDPTAAAAMEKPAPEGTRAPKADDDAAAAKKPPEKPKPRKLEWTEQREWRDGTSARLAVDGPAAAWYLSRKLRTEVERTLTIQLEGGAGAKVWLNGNVVADYPPAPETPEPKADAPKEGDKGEPDEEEFLAAMFRGADRDSRRLRLGLRAGENHLVVKLIGKGAAPRAGRGGPAAAVPNQEGDAAMEAKLGMRRGGAGGVSFTFDLTAEGDDLLDYETMLALRRQAAERQAAGVAAGTPGASAAAVEPTAPPAPPAATAAMASPSVQPVAAEANAAATPPPPTPSERRNKTIRRWYRTRIDIAGRALFEEMERFKKEKARIEQKLPQALVMEELATPRPTHVFVRGDYRKKGEPVETGTPAVLPPMAADLPKNRLGLARWIVSPDNPLTARVTVNRAWQQFFGLGIVRTADDFGIRGALPSHPELLDWLACEFVASGWDVKRLHRLLALSAVYRQSSAGLPQALELDPENVLLARGPHQRLSAEMIRDQALSVAGLLVDKRGGPSVKPYQPPGVWSSVLGSGEWKPDSGEATWRRGLYVYWKRGVPYPSFTAFDAPKRETCTVTRARTTTPLQSLVLLNDPVYVEAGRGLGLRMLKEGGKEDAARLQFGFRLVASRRPEDRELATLQSLLDDLRKHYKADAKAAKKLLAVGSAKPDPKVDPAEAAAWAQLGATLLNLEAAIRRG